MNLTFNILTTLSARIVTLGLFLISSIILARWPGPEGRGVFALVLLLSARNTSSVERTRAALERSGRVCGSIT
jgi:hypothetical protein